MGAMVVERCDKSHIIMQAAETLFTSRRFHEITMDDIAEEAGVGKGTIYRYFRDKDDLFFRTATNGFDELCELLRREVPGHVCCREQLLAASHKIGEFFQNRRQLLRMIQTEDGRMAWCQDEMRERWLERRKNLVAAVSEMIRKGIADGEIRSDIPSDILAHFLLGMLRTQGRELGDVLPDSRRHEIVVDLFLRGVMKRLDDSTV